MPNGGPDCCGNCGFNKAAQEMAHPHPDQREKFWALSPLHATRCEGYKPILDVLPQLPLWKEAPGTERDGRTKWMDLRQRPL